MSCVSRRLGVALALLSALCSVPCAAQAQDALGPGADFSDDWDAILKLAPPPSMAATDTRRRGRSQVDERESSRSGQRGTVASKERESAKEREGTPRTTRDDEPSSQRRDRSVTSERQTRSGPDEKTARPVRSQQVTKDDARARKPGDSASAASDSAKNAAEDTRAYKDSANAGNGSSEQLEVPVFAPGGYEGLRRSWHAPWPDSAAQQAAVKVGAAPALSLHPAGRLVTPYVLIPRSIDGGFDDAQLAVASKAFGSWPGGPTVSARLLDLIYHAASHFGVFHVHLISGVRRDRSGSRHSHALAADIVLPGVSDAELAAYFRPQGFLGVGIYTRAGFVHVDVRERSYFWLDKSPPGRRMKIFPERAEEAKAADEAALARGQSGYVNPPRLQKALHARYKRRLAQTRIAQ